MLILALDTNSQAGSVALLEGRQLLGEVNIDAPVTHSERVIPAVDHILKMVGKDLSEVEGYALAVGPGSFTGIRIGMSTVKAFARAFAKPIAPVSNLRALAMKLELPQARLLCPVIDAKKGEVYAGLFESRARKVHEIVPQGLYHPDRLLSRFPAQRVISFIGSGAVAYRDRIRTYFRDKARFPLRSPYIACEVGWLGERILRAGKGVDFYGLEPLYFRKSQAEETHR